MNIALGRYQYPNRIKTNFLRCNSHTLTSHTTHAHTDTHTHTLPHSLQCTPHLIQAPRSILVQFGIPSSLPCRVEFLWALWNQFAL